MKEVHPVFREMMRKKQQLPMDECIRLLTDEPRGVLSVIGDEGYPYGMPMDHFYCPEDGKLYFHSAIKGHKVDAIKRCDMASYCVYDQGYRKEGEWALNIKSVIVFSRIEIVSDMAFAEDIIRRLSLKYTDDADYIESEIRQALDHTLIFALKPEHITGKLVNEA